MRKVNFLEWSINSVRAMGGFGGEVNNHYGSVERLGLRTIWYVFG